MFPLDNTFIVLVKSKQYIYSCDCQHNILTQPLTLYLNVHIAKYNILLFKQSKSYIYFVNQTQIQLNIYIYIYIFTNTITRAMISTIPCQNLINPNDGWGMNSDAIPTARSALLEPPFSSSDILNL